MHFTTNPIIFIVFLTALVFSCKKDPPIDPEPTEPVMPPLTHQGLNTFGCYIDGELFVANDGDGYWDVPAVSGSFDEEEGYLGLQGSRYTEEFDDNIRIRVSGILGEGDYKVEMFGDNMLLAYRNWGGDRCDYYYDTIVSNMSHVKITYLNKQENVIAGTFYMNLKSNDFICDSEDTLMKITDGRFDFHY